MRDGAEARIAGDVDDRRARGRGLLVEVAAERGEAGVIREIGDGQLAELLRGGLAVERHGDDAGLADDDGRPHCWER